MKQVQFEELARPRWVQLEKALSSKRKRKGSNETHDLPRLYREVSRDLAVARERRYSPELLEQLNTMVLRGHGQLYRERREFLPQAFEFLLAGYPRMVRARWKGFLFCMLTFSIPFGLLWYAGSVAPDWIFAILPDATIDQLESSFGGELIEGRAPDRSFAMFAHYIGNNVGIDFRVFAGGILAGIGSLFFLAYNALVLGAASGYILHSGHNEQFMAFVSGHSALEITGLWLSCLAGLELGFAWLLPGRRSRRYALVEGAKSALLLLGGAATMTAMAAVIEAFWSPGPAAPIVKYWVGGILWALVLGHLAFAGRGAKGDMDATR